MTKWHEPPSDQIDQNPRNYFALGASLALGMGVTTAIADRRIPLEDCEPVYSVQYDQCEVSHIMFCPLNGETIVQEVSIEDGDLPYVSFSTTDFQIIRSFDEDYDDVISEVNEIRDPTSLSTLLEVGTDSSDVTFSGIIPPFVRPWITDLTDEYRLTGQTARFGAYTFEHIEYRGKMTVQASGLQINLRANGYLDREKRVMFPDKMEMEILGSSADDLGRVAAVLGEGDAFFMEDIPLYGCGELSQVTNDVIKSPS